MNLTEWPLLWVFGLFVAGLVLLFGGGNALVKGSSQLARMLGIHPIVVGLTVVAFGTSMPEFLVSLIAALTDKPDVALGNIIGSNVSNIGFILGLSALVSPIAIHLKLLKFEVPLVVGVSLYFWLICFNGTLSRLDGLTLTVGFVIYIVVVVVGAKKDSSVLEEKYRPISGDSKRILFDIVLIIIGIAALTLGARWIVDSASEISRRLGVPELILGLTIVALGTSLPELATSLVAAIKKEGDISVGNIIGSNIFNMMAIAGPSALVHPLVVTEELKFNHLPIMVGLTILLFPFVKTGGLLTRKEGAVLLACYFGIMVWWIV